MIACSDFRNRFHAGTDDVALLEHVRSCDVCLDYAAHIDPDVMFRAIGGGELVPPGGIDAFTADVMHAVRIRGTEGSIIRPDRSWIRQLAIAATVTVGAIAGLIYQLEHRPAAIPTSTVAAIHRPAVRQLPLTTKPAVEAYSSANATIVEVPDESLTDNTQIVMIVDENLPADL